jgi:hypothetical protein
MGGMQDEGIALEGLRRAVVALDDLDTVALRGSRCDRRRAVPLP